ncbi:MAG TPA: type IV toxin-antitoxin system AbiEi family antitoxin domain-containing protein, partial [Jiangellaceae bacterium]|nr:type IV toxin-antitoxin system AbiEi family antitoxin domain-containing protein [Jiangellaceae bacterium]
MDLPPQLRSTDLADLIECQCGVVSAGQLRAKGVDVRAARRWVADGRWQRPHHGVFATFSGPLTRTAKIWAAILRVHPDAVASHATAAELDGMDEPSDERIHITAPVHRRIRGKIDGVVVHYAHRLSQTRHPAKSPPRTRIEDTVLDLVDIAHSARIVNTLVSTVVQKRLTTTDRLAAALMGRKKISWRPLVDALLLDVAEGAQSTLELQHLRRVERAHGLPSGQRQRRRAGARVVWIDVDYDEYDLRIELDGRLGHEGDGRFRDRQRDNRGVVEQTWTLRYGHAELFDDPCAVAAEQACVLYDR